MNAMVTITDIFAENEVQHIEVSMSERAIYWSSYTSSAEGNGIKSIKTDGSGLRDVITEGVGKRGISGLAIDWLAGIISRVNHN